MQATDVKYIVSDELVRRGKPIVEGHRITVHDLAAGFQMGDTPEDLAAAYGLRPAQVHAALTYYYDHKEQIDRDIEADDAYVRREGQKASSSVARRIHAAVKAREDQLARQ